MQFRQSLMVKAASIFAVHVWMAGACVAQIDPGPRGGPAGAGGGFAGLNSTELRLFNQALSVFQEVDSVSGQLPGEPGAGLGLAQPDFATQLANHNVIFRIPTPTFGLGLVENTPDAALQANLAANASAKAGLGIAGRLNTTGNDGTVTRFGWKAQNKSLLIFAGEAYNVEQGVSNELFPNERSAAGGCVFNGTPEDATDVGSIQTANGLVTKTSGDTVSFAIFMRLSAAPAPTTQTPSELNGAALFNSTGCVLCHTSTLQTANSPYTNMSQTTYHPFSDFALHHMGSNLSDGVSQGAAGPDEFRTAPLWGLGQRLFFLHDGRTSDLDQAIQAHSSKGSEAKGVIANYNALTPSQKQDILNFLRSL